MQVLRTGWIPLLLIIFITGCHRDMYDQPKYEPLETSTFFEDGRSARKPVDNTVAVDEVLYDEYFMTGMRNGQVGTEIPIPVTEETLARGQEVYNINCVPCHGLAGYGNGMVWRRGGVPPANFHSDRLRTTPVGHFYDVITNGYRYMYPYAHKIAPEDRWAIIAYIRALQLSQHATLDTVPADMQQDLQSQTPEATPMPEGQDMPEATPMPEGQDMPEATPMPEGQDTAEATPENEQGAEQ
jgi:mono/diheme cytochrome c family protein